MTDDDDIIAIVDEGVMDYYGGYEKNRRILSEKTSAEYTGKGYRDETVDTYHRRAVRFVKAVNDMIGREQ
ncbi:MAG: hypothetical protein ABEJ62_01820 [Candidatus Nanohaloarchaea archaeon]